MTDRKKKISMYVAAAAFAASVILHAAVAFAMDNIVSNGDFEAGTEHWTMPTVGSYSITEDAYGGTGALQKISGGYTKMYQTVAVEKNMEYYVSAYAKNPGGGYFQMFASRADGLNNTLPLGGANKISPVVTVSDGSTKWKQHGYAFNSGDNEFVTLVFQADFGLDVDTNKKFILDNIKMGKRKPNAEEVCAAGYFAAGRKAKAKAEICIPYFADTDGTSYEWQISDDGSSDWTVLSDEKELTVPQGADGKYIRLCVKPSAVGVDGDVYDGEAVYSKSYRVLDEQTVKAIDLGEILNAVVVGSVSDFEKCTSDSDLVGGMLLSRSGIEASFGDSNELSVNNIPYMVDFSGDKRAARYGASGDSLSVNLSDGFFSEIHVLGFSASDRQTNTKMIITYSDGTTQYNDCVFGSFMRNDGSAANTEAFGAYGGDGVIDGGVGYVYSHTVVVEKCKGIRSIEFQNAETEDEIVVMAVSGSKWDTDEIAETIEGQISSLPEEPALYCIDDIVRIQRLIRDFVKMGGDVSEISNYDVVRALLTEVRSIDTVQGLCDTTVKTMFTNPIDEECVDYEYIKIDGLDKTKYIVRPIKSGDDVIGVEAVILNDFTYETKKLTISGKIRCANAPYVEIGEEKTADIEIKQQIKAEIDAKAENGALRIDARIENKTAATQNVLLAALAYSDDGTVHGVFVKEYSLSANETRDGISDSVPINAPTGVKITAFAADSAEKLNVVYMQRLPVAEYTVEGDGVRTVHIRGVSESEMQGRIVSVLVKKKNEEKYAYVNAGLTGNGGTFAFDFVFAAPNETYYGEYDILVGGYDFGSAVPYGTTYFASGIELDAAVNGIKTQTKQELERNFGEFVKKLRMETQIGANSSQYSLLAGIIRKTLDEGSVAEITDVDDARHILKLCSRILNYNLGTAQCKDDGGLIDEHELNMFDADQNGVTLYDAFKRYISSDGRKKIHADMLGKDFGSYCEWYNGFTSAIVLRGIECPSVGGVGYVGQLITEQNAKQIGLATGKMFQLSDKSAVYEALARQSFSTINELSAAIVAAAEIPQSPPSGGGVSGGKGGTGVVGFETVGTASPNTEYDPSNSAMFVDVENDSWAYNYIYYLKQKNIISGDASGNFNPDGNITREQFVKILCEAFGIKTENSAMKFDDVKDGEWYAEYIRAAFGRGIVKGISENMFGVGEHLTRQDLCVMALRAYATLYETEVIGSSNGKKVFQDSELISDYAAEAIEFMYENGIVAGNGDGSFRPLESCTRAETAKIIYGLLEFAEESKK